MVAAVFLAASAVLDTDSTFELRCSGLEAYEIRVQWYVDWGYGTIRARDGSASFGVSYGPMAPELVPEARPAGYRTFVAERLGNVVFTHGHYEPDDQYRATMSGVPRMLMVNLTGKPQDREALLEIARVLATNPCASRAP